MAPHETSSACMQNLSTKHYVACSTQPGSGRSSASSLVLHPTQRLLLSSLIPPLSLRYLRFSKLAEFYQLSIGLYRRSLLERLRTLPV